ncbi:hypothetical protein B0H34DRAFT_44995 [Crassisporium funariophilum]|nr:hypothetical protein B0H34DRAFT_44995 [Crassisporium funariophilum]
MRFILLRPVCLVLHASAFLAIGDFLSAILFATATPIPLPLPLMTTDHSLSLVWPNRTFPRVTDRNLPVERNVRGVKYNRDSFIRDATLADGSQYLDAANLNTNNLKDLAAKSANVQESDFDFQRDSASELSSFSTNMLGFQTAFVKSASESDRGLANYDRKNDLETLLKQYINLHKNALSAVSVLVYNIPGLGPILGPIIYEIKCIIDEILNATEEFTDAAINELQGPLRAIFGSAVTLYCGPDVEIAGLCL